MKMKRKPKKKEKELSERFSKRAICYSTGNWIYDTRWYNCSDLLICSFAQVFICSFTLFPTCSNSNYLLFSSTVRNAFNQVFYL